MKDESKKDPKSPNEPNEQPNADNGNGQNNRITVSVRYQEASESVETNIHESVTALLQAAINATGNGSTPKERFQLKLDGTVLDPKAKVDDYPIKDGSLLVLVLIAGGGGSY
jgi:hypothetical protein